MPTPAELAYGEQLGHLQEIASARKWNLKEQEGMTFILGLPAKDGTRFWLKTECGEFLSMPPAWHWYNPDSENLEQPGDTPKGSGYFHSSGRICAPWNRLAYKQYDPQGPHGDWILANWTTNPKTGQCTTLAAMALRISVELHRQGYQGRMA